MNNNETVNYQLSQGIGTISLNRPEKLNAVNVPMIHALHKALQVANEDEACKGIVLNGSGRAFCVGDDLEENATPPESKDEIVEITDLIQDITRLLMLNDKPTICAVQGWAVGAGFSWTLNCDVAIWSDQAKGFLPELSHGLFATGAATFLVPQRAGHGFATSFMMTGQKQNAQSLVDAGLATEIVEDSQLDAVVAQTAQALTTHTPEQLRTFKRAVTNPFRSQIEAALETEAEACLQSILTRRR